MTAFNGRTVVVTGAGGYIGSAVVREARERGARVHALARGAQSRPDAEVIPFVYDLKMDLPDAFGNVDAVIHLAFDNAADVTAPGSDLNTLATLRVRDAAHRAGVPRFIFVSSQSALGNAHSAYARSKAATEGLLAQPPDVIVRPGMVYGGAPKGLYGQLCSLVQKARILPVPYAAAPLQPIHVDELASALMDIALKPMLTRSYYNLAASHPTTLAAFLQELAVQRFRKKLAVVPVPLGPLPALLRAVAGVHPLLRGISERLSGLEAFSPMQVEESLSALSISLQDFGTALRREAQRSSP